LSRLIAFDVDSTLLRVESLDTAVEQALADQANAAEARARLHELTASGMSGRIALRDSLLTRIALARMSRTLVDEVAETLRKRITPGMKPVIARLRDQGDELHAISGGFVDLLEPVLTDLGFARGNIHANEFVYEDERVVGLDEDNPLSRNGGKTEVLASISARASDTIMVGDGMTDFEAYEGGAADRFIGFGVVVEREIVLAAAAHSGGEFVRSVDALMSALRR